MRGRRIQWPLVSVCVVASLLVVLDINSLWRQGDKVESKRDASGLVDDIGDPVDERHHPRAVIVRQNAAPRQSIVSQRTITERRRDLIQEAVGAAEHEDELALAESLLALGELALDELEFDVASRHLENALRMFRSVGDETGIARSHLQIGRLHVRLRARARVAGDAYDRLLVGRAELARGQLELARANLRAAVELNLEINRLRAAADALVSLADAFFDGGDFGLAERSAADAARLYPQEFCLGESSLAISMLERLGREGHDPAALDTLSAQVSEDLTNHQMESRDLRRAADLNNLSNHYESMGDLRKAWQLRLKANRHMGKVASRAAHRHVPDAIALLYASNFDMTWANEHLRLAADVFYGLGRDDLVAAANDLLAEIR